MDDFVYRLGKRAKLAVFSISEPMNFAETLFKEFTTEERALVWKQIQAGQFPVVPDGTDSEVRRAVEHLLKDKEYRDQIQYWLADREMKLMNTQRLEKEAIEWLQKRKNR